MKPPLPDSTLRALENQFIKLAGGDDCTLSPYDLQIAWGWSYEEVADLLAKYDINEDQYIDQLEYIQMMCPPEYKIDGEDAAVKRLLTKWLHGETSIRKRIVKHDSDCRDVRDWLQPDGFLPLVPAHLLSDWEDVFKSIDRTSD